jgi:hypothetical protein
MKFTLKGVNFYEKGNFKSGDFSFEIESPAVAPISDSSIVSNLNNCFVLSMHTSIISQPRKKGYRFFREKITYRGNCMGNR